MRKALLFLAVPVVMAGVGWMSGDPAEGGIIFRRWGSRGCSGASVVEAYGCSGAPARTRWVRMRSAPDCCGSAIMDYSRAGVGLQPTLYNPNPAVEDAKAAVEDARRAVERAEAQAPTLAPSAETSVIPPLPRQ